MKQRGLALLRPAVAGLRRVGELALQKGSSWPKKRGCAAGIRGPRGR